MVAAALLCRILSLLSLLSTGLKQRICMANSVPCTGELQDCAVLAGLAGDVSALSSEKAHSDIFMLLR